MPTTFPTTVIGKIEIEIEIEIHLHFFFFNFFISSSVNKGQVFLVLNELVLTAKSTVFLFVNSSVNKGQVFLVLIELIYFLVVLFHI